MTDPFLALRSSTFDELQDEISRASSAGTLAVQPIEVMTTHDNRKPPKWQFRYEASPGVLFLWGHGDGMHMQLGTRALCGTAPHADDGCGCSYPGRCRKSRAVSGIDFAADAVGSVAFLLSCNSLNLAGQLGPRSLSIARTLIEHAGFVTVVGSARQIAFSRDDVEEAKKRWTDGWSVGEIVHALNALPSMPAGLYILGDPHQRIEGSVHRTVPYTGVQGELEEAGLPIRRLSARLDHAMAAATRLQGLSASNSRMQKALVRHLSLLDAQRRLLASAHANRLSGRLSPAVSNVWERAARTAGAIWNEIVHMAFMGGAGTSFGDVFQSVLAMGGGPDPSGAEPFGMRCSTCLGRVQLNRGFVFSGLPVVTLWCVGCGVQTIGLADEIDAQSLAFPTNVVAGEFAALSLRTTNLTGQSTVHIQIRDKSQHNSLVNEAFGFEGDVFNRVFEISRDAGPDIGSIRALVVDGPYISYQRRVFRIKGGD